MIQRFQITLWRKSKNKIKFFYSKSITFNIEEKDYNFKQLTINYLIRFLKN